MGGLTKLLLAAIASLALSPPTIAEEDQREMHFERGIVRITAPNLEETVQSEPTGPLNLTPEYHYSSQDLKKYQSWIKKCVNQSKNDRFCLVIDKAAHEMDVYQDQQKIATFSVELGLNPYDDKRRRGDNSTPEGLYNIKWIVKNSAFYQALYVGYPNAEDKSEFRRLKKTGKIPKKADIGGSIEIHGSGAEKESDKSDWTAGCIALSNQDMDQLYRHLCLEHHPEMKSQERRKAVRKITTCVVKYGARESY
ncbi:L,D-transpeptidase family protein [Candidatus Woesearchaeota archaeon]|nr:L,D-transpeptidase family protein [Candidatus Woesearchaeota archaeon]